MKVQKQFTKDDTLAMKGVAIILLFFHHCFMSEDRFEGYAVSFDPFSQNIIVYLAFFSKICVGIFVFLSAYGITLSLKKLYDNQEFDKEHISWACIRRIWHILAGFWPAYLLCLVGTLLFKPENIEVYGGGWSGWLYGVVDALGLAKLMDTPSLVGTWWYLSLAIVQVFLMPLLVMLYYKLGIVWLGFISCFFTMVFRLEMTDFVRWIPCMVIGIWFADKDYFARLWAKKTGPMGTGVRGILKFVGLLVCLLAGIYLRNSSFGKGYPSLTDSAATMLVILFSVMFIIGIPIVRKVLMVLGKYSMNMFLIHTFIRVRWFEEFTYSFHYWWLILLVLLLDSFLVAAALDFIKDRLKYHRFVKLVEDKLRIIIRQ